MHVKTGCFLSNSYTLVLSWSFSGPLLVLFLFLLGPFWPTFWSQFSSFSIFVYFLVLSWSFPGPFLVLSWSFPGSFLVHPGQFIKTFPRLQSPS